jgi:hypothetical protein
MDNDFQSPRHVKVVPNQNTTEVTVHSGPVKGNTVSAVYVPVTPQTHTIFLSTPEFPDSWDPKKGGPRRESVWSVKLTLRNDGTCVSQPRDSP